MTPPRARKKALPKEWRVLIGLSYGPKDTRAEPGAKVDDLPESAIPGLLEIGAIEPWSEDHGETPR